MNISRLEQLKEIVKKLNQNDTTAYSFMNYQVPKVIFYILLKTSIALFSFGTMLTLNSQSLDKQRIITYILAPSNIVRFVFLAILGVLTLVIINEVRQSTNFKPKTNKLLDFITDILRSVFYFSTLYFMLDFVVENQEDRLLVASAWLFTIASILFVIRKVIKWKIFYFTAEGLEEFRPWTTKQNKINILQLFLESNMQLSQKERLNS